MNAFKQVAIKWTFHFLWVKREATLRISDPVEFQHSLAYFVENLTYMSEVNILIQESEGTLINTGRDAVLGH